MPDNSHETFGSPLQEFTAPAITDPGELATLPKKVRRSIPPLPHLWRWIGAGAIAVAFLGGVLLGYFILSGK